MVNRLIAYNWLGQNAKPKANERTSERTKKNGKRNNMAKHDERRINKSLITYKTTTAEDVISLIVIIVIITIIILFFIFLSSILCVCKLSLLILIWHNGEMVRDNNPKIHTYKFYPTKKIQFKRGKSMSRTTATADTKWGKTADDQRKPKHKKATALTTKRNEITQ